MIEAGDAAPTTDALAAPVETAAPEVEVQPQADTCSGNGNYDPDGAPRRGWWQRTFG